MRRQNPDHKMNIPISMAVHWQLVGASIRTGFQKEDWEIAAEAIDEWVRRHDPDGVPMAPTSGYQWKSLFLPDGTMLRTVFGGKNYHCQVENDHILYNGQAVSPSGFINAVGGVRRNAWRSTWILRPEDKHWVLADTARTPGRYPRKRKSTPEFKRASATPTSTDSAPSRHALVAEQVTAQEEPTKSPLSDEPSVTPQHQTEPRASNASRKEHDGTQHNGTTRSPPPCTCARERRTNGDHQLSPMLRDELRRLLKRTHIPEDERREAPSGTSDARFNPIAGNVQRR